MAYLCFTSLICYNRSKPSDSNGAVRRMRTRIRLQAQPEPMRSIVGATQQEQRFD
jgi:hypothetical protein